MIGPCTDGGDVRRNAWGSFEIPLRKSQITFDRLGGGRVRDNLPVVRRRNVELEFSLEIWLIETGVNAAGIGDLELGVKVNSLVNWVDESVQTFAGAHVLAVGDDDERIFGAKPMNG